MTRYSEFLGRDIIVRDNNGADTLTWESVFDAEYHVPPLRMATPETVLDLGSNIGLTCAYYRKLWPAAKVVGVEMNAENVVVAKQNADCEVLHYAVSDVDGDTAWYDPREFATSFSLEREYAERTRGIDTKRLSTLIEEEFDGHVDFVKMDIEGSEWRVLSDPKWVPMVKNLMLELHGDNPLFTSNYAENTPDNLVTAATHILGQLGFHVDRHPVHRQSVFAWS